MKKTSQDLTVTESCQSMDLRLSMLLLKHGEDELKEVVFQRVVELENSDERCEVD